MTNSGSKKKTAKKAAKKTTAKKKVVKKAVSQKAAAKPTASKKMAPRRAILAKRKATIVSDDEKRMMIAMHAYYKWENAGFPGGQDWHHWLEAEQEIEDMLG